MNSFELILLCTFVRSAAVVLLLLAAGRHLSSRHMRTLWLIGCCLILIPQTTLPFLPFLVDLSGLRGEGSSFCRMLQEGTIVDRRMLELLLIPLLPAGALLLLGRRYRRCRKLMRNLPPVTDPRTLATWKRLTEGQGALRFPPILLDSSGATAVPALFGVFHPRLLLPGDKLALLTGEELSLLLEHEYCHIAEKDPFRNLFSLLFWSLSWYNPFAWIARRELRRVIEQECDRRVLESRPDSMERYGKLLLRFASGRNSFSLALAESPRELKQRIRLLAFPGRRCGSRIVTWALILFLAAPLCLVAVRVHAVKSRSAVSVAER